MLIFFWLILGAIFLIIEVITASFFIIFFGLAALTLACLIIFFTLNISQQVFLFLCLSVFFLFFAKKIFKRKKRKTYSCSYALIGEYGLASEDIYPNGYGKVIIRDIIWKATSTSYVQKGSSVRVISQNNLTLEVK